MNLRVTIQTLLLSLAKLVPTKKENYVPTHDFWLKILTGERTKRTNMGEEINDLFGMFSELGTKIRFN